MVKDNLKVENQVVVLDEPCEEKARMEGELFPGEIDNLLKLVNDWTKKKKKKKKSK